MPIPKAGQKLEPLQVSTLKDNLEPGWRKILAGEFDKPYMSELVDFLRQQASAHKKVYPTRQQIFRALNATPFDNVRVVILGQDPYHGPNQANGLSFSVPAGMPLPPSLRNIYKELASDLKTSPPQDGDLNHWAQQGVLLLNAVLSVEEGLANSHAGKGWEAFTDKILSVLSQQKSGLVFVLWGNYAQRKSALIDASKHCVLKAAHPSPLSAHRGFFGSKPFSHINRYFKDHGKREISWVVPINK